MPFNGTGTFVLTYNWETDQSNGILVRADRMDTQEQDMADGLSLCLTLDGQSTPVADLPMGTFRLTGLGNGAAPADSVNFAQVFNSPVFTTPSAAATPLASDNSTRLATTAYVVQKAFSTALPAQSGHSLLITNGVTASWGADMTGNSGKRLTTNGTIPAWAFPVGEQLFLNSTQGGF